MKPTESLNPGTIIKEQYEIVKQMGHGGMARTYIAQDKTNPQQVILKEVVLTEMESWKTLELFEREAKTLKNLDHPNIPKYIEDFHIESDKNVHYYLVMEYIKGDNLYDLIKDGKRFTEQDVLKILTSLLEILDYIHNLYPAVIHRDIQPKNIIYREDGQVYLVDFGGVGQIVKETLLGGSTIIGTFGYFPYEQLLGKAFPSSDLYSLGMTMIFILTGKDPSKFDLINGKANYKAFSNTSDLFNKTIDSMIEPLIETRAKDAESILRSLGIYNSNITIEKDHNTSEKLKPIMKILISIPSSYTSYGAIENQKQYVFISKSKISFGASSIYNGENLDSILMSCIKTLEVTTDRQGYFILNIIDRDNNILTLGKGFQLQKKHVEKLKNIITRYRTPLLNLLYRLLDKSPL